MEEGEGSDDTQQVIEESAPIVVDVKGAVQAPGVYQMEKGDRVIDVIEKAGGLIVNANDDVVNFAQILYDEMVIYVPKKGEEVKSEFNSSMNSNKININSASVSELMTLKGIGEAKAEAIVSYREQHGKFDNIDDLLKIKGIGDKTIENFRDKIIAY
ncbi:helix-hairpin-helix domain-containing protein [Lottiidibacillus patelloidae]|nr:helix-hairpin-helix domain-containing protein [Lottiidibacillus patelloidae]